jgi:uncharacterized cupredoxin-like copper-binding protein
MRPVRLALLATTAIVLAACSGGAASPSTPTSASPDASAGATRIEVALTDSLKMEPATLSVPAGVPVTFVVTNGGALDHEFFIGDEAEQQAHADEMAEAGGGMTHDEEMGIFVDPGTTKELTVTFPAAGSTLAGCHVDGHYLGGMKATIEIGS